MKSVRIKNSYDYQYGILGPDGRMHAWCNGWEAARADLYNCVHSFPGSEIVAIEEDADAPHDCPDVNVIYVADE